MYFYFYFLGWDPTINLIKQLEEEGKGLFALSKVRILSLVAVQHHVGLDMGNYDQ